MSLPRLEYPGGASPGEWGHLHGSKFVEEILAVAQIRLDLCTRIGGFASEQQVLEIAEQHLPVLREFSPDLHAEIVAIAAAVETSPARIVVLNHYTDLRDIASASPSPELSGCSAMYARPGGGGTTGPLLGQTWDMHASAAPFTMMLKVPAPVPAWLVTIMGCVGLAGMNAAGVGITINNLRSLDARIGVVWPAVVRRALEETTAEGARDVIVNAALGSGHHYLVADARAVYGIETSGRRRAIVFDGGERYIHTNHCFDPKVGEVSTVAPGSSTYLRHDRLAADARAVTGVDDLWSRLATVNMRPPASDPHGFATCSAIVMDLGARRLWASAGGDTFQPQEYTL